MSEHKINQQTYNFYLANIGGQLLTMRRFFSVKSNVYFSLMAVEKDFQHSLVDTVIQQLIDWEVHGVSDKVDIERINTLFKTIQYKDTFALSLFEKIIKTKFKKFAKLNYPDNDGSFEHFLGLVAWTVTDYLMMMSDNFDTQVDCHHLELVTENRELSVFIFEFKFKPVMLVIDNRNNPMKALPPSIEDVESVLGLLE